MSFNISTILSSLSSLAALGFYIWVIVMFARERKKPAGERRAWPKVLFIIFTCIYGLVLLLAVLFIALSVAIVASM